MKCQNRGWKSHHDKFSTHCFMSYLHLQSLGSLCIQSCSWLHFWACFLKSGLARPCTRLQGRPCRDSCSLRSCEPKSLFGKRPACLQCHLLRPWGSSRSGSCLRRWHCRTLAPKLSNMPLERQACSLWNPFHLCYSQTSETVLSASILLLYLTSISIRIKGSQSTTSRKARVRGQEEAVLSTSALPPIYPLQQSFCPCSFRLLVTPLM